MYSKYPRHGVCRNIAWRLRWREPDVAATLAIYQRSSGVAKIETGYEAQVDFPPNLADRRFILTPRTRSNRRENRYALYTDGGSDYIDCMAQSGRKEDARNRHGGDNRYRRFGFLITDGRALPISRTTTCDT